MDYIFLIGQSSLDSLNNIPLSVYTHCICSPFHYLFLSLFIQITFGIHIILPLSNRVSMLSFNSEKCGNCIKTHWWEGGTFSIALCLDKARKITFKRNFKELQIDYQPNIIKGPCCDNQIRKLKHWWYILEAKKTTANYFLGALIILWVFFKTLCFTFW